MLSKLSQYRSIYVLAILSILATFFYIASGTKNRQLHLTILNQLHGVKQHDALIDRDLLSIKSNLLNNYDSITYHFWEMEHLLNDLLAKHKQIIQTPHFILPFSANAEKLDASDIKLSEQLKEFQQSFNSKRALTERFKALHAIRKNSHNSFSLIANKLLEKHRNVTNDGPLIRIISNLLHHISFFALNTQNSHGQVVEKDIADLKKLAANYPQSQQSILSLARHAELIYQQTSASEELIKKTLDPLHFSIIENIHTNFAKRFIILQDITSLYRTGLFFIVVLLLGITLFIGYRLHKAKYVVAKHNEILENKVQERTYELELSTKKAEEATKIKSEFLANMSHEIRTPMNGILGINSLLRKTSLNPQQQHYAENIKHSAESLLELINDILDISKIEAGKLSLEEVPLDLEAIINRVTQTTRPTFEQKGIELLVDFPLNVARYATGDPGRIQQVILNLVSNAVKFTEEGHVIIRIEQLPPRQKGKLTFTISVEDTGIGIPQDKLELIFNKFDQADGSTTRKFGGTGLGLGICRKLADMMEGEVKVTSEEGAGSVFSFTMQLSEATDQSDNLYSLPTNLEGCTVLVVDNYEYSARMLTKTLEELQMQAIFATTEKEALDILMDASSHDQTIDFVITDNIGKEKGGIEFAQFVRFDQHFADTKVLLLTASQKEIDIDLIENTGINGFLYKPFLPVKLVEMLAKMQQAKIDNTSLSLLMPSSIEHDTNAEQDNTLSTFNAHVLLVEDNPINQIVATTILENCDCTVTPAGNGIEAVDNVIRQKFDLIFMDCQMPEMDGFEASQKIREYEKKRGIAPTPIIAFTANVMSGDKERCLEAGMDDYISKPVVEGDIEKALKRWLVGDNAEISQDS